MKKAGGVWAWAKAAYYWSRACLLNHLLYYQCPCLKMCCDQHSKLPLSAIHCCKFTVLLQAFVNTLIAPYHMRRIHCIWRLNVTEVAEGTKYLKITQSSLLNVRKVELNCDCDNESLQIQRKDENLKNKLRQNHFLTNCKNLLKMCFLNGMQNVTNTKNKNLE